MDAIDKIAWIRLAHGRILSTRSRGKDVWYLPGGKREPGETDRETLTREIAEELGVVIDPETAVHVGTFTAQAHGHPAGTLVRMTCYQDAGQCSALQGGGEGPRGEGRQGPSRAVDSGIFLPGSGDNQAGARRTTVAAGLAETINACGADVRPGRTSADRGEAGTHLGVARSARSAEGIPAIHGGGGSQTAEHHGEPRPDHEIEEVAWLGYADRDRVSPVDRIIFDDLRRRALLG